MVGTECERCHHKTFPPAEVCSNCLSGELTPVRLSREGVLYSYTVVHVAPQDWRTPYVIGYVDLPEGVRVFANVAGGPEELRVDAKVRLEAETIDGRDGGSPVVYRFVPAEEVEG